MLKIIIMILFQCIVLYAQENTKINKSISYINKPVVSLKAGVHSKDSKTYTYQPTTYIPFGFSIDLNIEYPFGKSFYGSIDIDLSYARGKIYDDFHKKEIDIKNNITNISLFLLKYRFFLKSWCFNVSTGIGITYIRTITNFNYNPDNNNMVHYTVKAGVDYIIYKNLAASIEGTYYGMGELKIDVGGGGGEARSNKLFQIKGGLSLFLL